jgi:hypothetical protein
MATGLLADLGNVAESDFSCRSSTRVQVSSLRRFGEASRLPASEALRSGLGAIERCSAESLVLLEIDFPFAMPPLSVAKLPPAVFGRARILHFAALNNRQLSEVHSRSARERLWEAR